MQAKVLLHPFDEKFKAFAYFNVVNLREGFNPGFIAESREGNKAQHAGQASRMRWNHLKKVDETYAAKNSMDCQC